MIWTKDDRHGIACVFKGVVYRSRTEGKWAVFFDHLGLLFDPEVQGYDSWRGTSYLPDFLVHAARGPLWIEVKPTMEADPDGVQRWRNFAAQRPDPAKSRAVLLIGAPRIYNDTIVIGGDEDAEDPGDGPWDDEEHIWRPCPSGRHIDVGFPGRYFSKFPKDGCEDKFGGRGCERIAAAVEAATSFNFKRPTPRGTAE